MSFDVVVCNCAQQTMEKLFNVRRALRARKVAARVHNAICRAYCWLMAVTLVIFVPTKRVVRGFV